MAEQEGDVEKVGKLTTRLVELEERADLLDKQRTKGLSAIRCYIPLLFAPLINDIEFAFSSL